MIVFTENNGNLKKISEKEFDLEKDIQKITEKNLVSVFGLKLVKSEFQLNDLRLDTLAFDPESNSFVVIEYKKDKNFSVIDQGFAYLGMMLNNKAAFILEYYQNISNSLKQEDIDWSQSRVMFVAPSFTNYQQKAIHFKDLPIELWEIKKYENSLIVYERLKSPESSESITKISPSNPILSKVSAEIKVYTEDDHLGRDDRIDELYGYLKSQILSLGDNVLIEPKKLYIAFKRNTNFVDLEIQKARIKIFINLEKSKLVDHKNICRDVQKLGHYGNGDYEVTVNDKNEVPYLLTLIKQSYDAN